MKSIKHISASLGVAALITIGGIGCSGGGGGSEASFCSTLKKWQSDTTNLESGTPGSEEFTESMNKAKKALGELEKSAPAEISDDMKTLSEGFDKISEIDLSDPSSIDPSAMEVDEEALDKATENIEAYAKDKCGVDLNE